MLTEAFFNSSPVDPNVRLDDGGRHFPRIVGYFSTARAKTVFMLGGKSNCETVRDETMADEPPKTG